MSNISSTQINQARELIDQNNDVLIAIKNNASLDDVAAALSLYLALSSHGKRAQIACSQQMTVRYSHLIGIDKIKNNLNNGGKNLIISFPYQEGSIEKVSYNIENETFNLVIEPREGYPTITQDLIRFSSGGNNSGLIITVGATKFSDLDSLYINNESLFRDKPTINIDYHSQNTNFGKLNLIDPDISSASELMTNILSIIGYTVDNDIATNLLAGITDASQNFTSYNTTAQTFELAALCLKSGARKVQNGQYIQNNQIKREESPIPSFQKPQPKMQFQKYQPLNQNSYMPKQTMNPKPQQPSPQNIKDKNDAPPDWLKPKIYKGSTLL